MAKGREGGVIGGSYRGSDGGGGGNWVQGQLSGTEGVFFPTLPSLVFFPPSLAGGLIAETAAGDRAFSRCCGIQCL